MYRIGFRANGGKLIGLGHLRRCLSLAIELQEIGNEIYFITNNNYEIIVKNGFKIVDITRTDPNRVESKRYENLNHEVKSILDIINEYKFDCLIVDHYGATDKYLRKIRNYLKVLVFIDDFCNVNSPVDILINGNVYADEKSYENHPKKTKYLLGTNYTLLRKEFMDLPKRELKYDMKDIMITTGGADNHNLTLRLLNLLLVNQNTQKLHFRVIIGKFFKNITEIENLAKKFNNIELIYNPLNMANIMQNCDLALSTSGTTLYELAITGTPSISFIVASNQEILALKMNDLNCTLNLGWHNKINDTDILENILHLINNSQLRMKMSELGHKIFDGKGAYRCSKAILNELKRDS